MQVIRTVEEMQSTAISLRSGGRLVGFVPTMGALHEGHLGLIDVAQERCDVVVVSIFVNPAQFAPNEDFGNYPRDLEVDLEKCRARGAHYVFVPKQEDIFPADFSTYVVEEQLSKGLCGVSRPGHFRGVATVVMILFNLVRPDVAVFGQKDGQQAAVIRRGVRDLHIPVEIIVGPTVREDDGLALSSRNRYLNPEQRRDAARIPEALEAGRELVERGTSSVERVRAEVTHRLTQSRRLRVIYVEVVDKDTMRPLREIVRGQTMVAVAVWLDQTRLIDNVLV